MSLNKVMLIGRLGADPETRTAQSGTMVANLNLATSERQKDRDGNWGERTEWHRVICFGRTAENVGRYLTKGRQVYVEGRIQTRKWTDRDGNDKWTTEIIAHTIRFLGSKNDGDDRGRRDDGYDRGRRDDSHGRDGGRSQGSEGRSQGSMPYDYDSNNNDIDDIPF
jgi:single-strand DNA-binding protein